SGGASFQDRNKVGHKFQFFGSAGAPAQVEGGEQVGEVFTIEYLSQQDGIDERLQGGGGQIVFFGNRDEFGGVFPVLEPLIAGTDGGFVKSCAGLEAADVFGDRVPFINKLRIAGDQADELLTRHRLFPRWFLREVGDEFHDVV